MRKTLLALAAGCAALAFAISGPAFAEGDMCEAEQHNAMQLAALEEVDGKQDSGVLDKLKRLRQDGVAFCGQCTRNSDCGHGYKCAGRPECMECVKSP